MYGIYNSLNKLQAAKWPHQLVNNKPWRP